MIKTRQEIREELFASNPTTNVGGVIYGAGEPIFEELMEQWIDARVTSMPDDLAAAARKTWPNAAAFLAEFSMPELAAIELSIDPTIAALRLLLASWPADIYSDDPRIIGGLSALVTAKIITEERRAEIVAK